MELLRQRKGRFLLALSFVVLLLFYYQVPDVYLLPVELVEAELLYLDSGPASASLAVEVFPGLERVIQGILT